MDSHMGVLLVCFVLVTLVFGFLLMAFHFLNRANVLENEAKAQQQTNYTVFDTAWKVIEGQAGVAAEYRDSFGEIFKGIMEGRYSNANLVRWIQESNPHFDSSLFASVSNSIVSQRMLFQANQTRLISIQQEHNNLRTTFPGCWFVGSRPQIAIELVTSERTESTFRSGQENFGVNPFSARAASSPTISYQNNGAAQSNGAAQRPTTAGRP